jgi:hypothetical protein
MYEKLLLLPLVAIGLALVPMKQADARVSVGIGPVGIGFGYPAYRYSYYEYPGYLVITHAAITATTGVIHITERITTLGGRTTTAAIDITCITSVITTATKAHRLM